MALEDSKVIKDKLSESTDVLVLLMNNPSLDAMASSLALYHALKTTDKNITIASAATINTGGWELPGSNQITQKIGNRNLVISLNVDNKDAIDKVSYNLEEDGKTFNLIVQPKKGQKPLSSDQVNYSYAGATADLIFIVDAYNYQELGALYDSEKRLYDQATTVTITHNQIKKFATYHIDDKTKSSLSEVMHEFINKLSLIIQKDTATNLLAGIDVATNQLQSPSVSAATFKTIASLMEKGGSRQNKPAISNTSAPTTTNTPSAQQQAQPSQDQTANQSVPDDWLSPKIYKGSSVSKT